MDSTTHKITLQQQANQCVKCGLCLPHCPTYALTKNEGESPRGRIALMDGFASGQLSLTPKLQTYLDHCLTCRACEAVCPAHVHYGEMIDTTRALFAEQPNTRSATNKLPRSLQAILRYPWLLKTAAWGLWCYQRSGLQFLARKTGLLKLLHLARPDSLLPTLIKPQRWQTFYPAKDKEQGRVGLFTGCITHLVDHATLAATIKVLTACGYGVYVPRNQQCCGALHQHAGYPAQATQFAVMNKAAFQQSDINAIITVASGCTVNDAKEISQFLTEIDWPTSLRIQPLQQRVALHIPCSLQNILRCADANRALLAKIPQLELVEIPVKSVCCGAAGLYMLQQKEMANGLLENLYSHIERLKPDVVATANIGCHLHIMSALLSNKSTIRITHPIVLLAEQLL